MENGSKHKSPEQWLVIIGAAFLLLSLLGMLCGCTTTKTVQVPVEVERTVLRTDTLRLHSHSIDTIVERDSVFLWQRGDTITKEVTRWRYKVRLLTDTLWRARTDSVYVEKPVTITVEKGLTTWQRVKQRLGGLALSIVCALLVVAGVWAVFKLKRKI